MKNKLFYMVTFSAILVRTVLLSVFAIVISCNTNSKKVSERIPEEIAGNSQKPLRFVFIATCFEEEFFEPVKKGLSDAAALMDVKCEFTGTIDVHVQEQVKMVEKAIDDGYDGIALSIIHPTAFDQVISKAIDSGIPVVAFNVDDNTTENARFSAVCQDVYKAGRSQGKKALEFIPEGSEILMTVHSKGISALDERLRGAQDVLKERNITWKIIETGITPEGASQIITAELQANPAIKTVLCTGQADTEGAGIAIEKYFKGKGYRAAGFDLSPVILKHIKNGNLDFTIDQQPYIQGFYPVVQLAQYSRYGIKPSNIEAGANIVTSEIVDEVMALSKQGVR